MHLNFFEINDRVYVDPKTYFLKYLNYQNISQQTLIQKYHFTKSDFKAIKNHLPYPTQLLHKLNAVTSVSTTTWSNLNHTYQTGLKALNDVNQNNFATLINYANQHNYTISIIDPKTLKINLSYQNYLNDDLIIYLILKPYWLELTDDGWQIDELRQHHLFNASLKHQYQSQIKHLNFDDGILTLQIDPDTNQLTQNFDLFVNLNQQFDQLIQNQKG